MMEQRELTAARLAGECSRWRRHRTRGDGWRRGARMARPEAARVIVDRIVSGWRWRRGGAAASRACSVQNAANTPCPLRRGRRHRDERHRRAARQSRLRGERLGRRRSESTARLEPRLGVPRVRRPREEHVGDADVVVYSSAVRPANPEIAEAQRRGVPVIPRAEMLAELMRLRFSIAVAGIARQDDDDLDDRACARTGGTRSDGGDWRAAERVRQQRAARARRATWWPKRMRAIGRS